MKITLRKASALQNSIQDAIRNIEIKTNVQLNEFQDPSQLLDAANAALISNDQRRQDLLRALYSIRSLVGQANATAGINERLASAAYIDKRIGHLNAFLQEDAVQESMVVLVGKIDKIKNDKSERRVYGFNDTVNTGALAPEQVENFKTEQLALKKQKQKLNDEVLELNVRTEITLLSATADVLNREGLL
jgi:hypothetical protein